MIERKRPGAAGVEPIAVAGVVACAGAVTFAVLTFLSCSGPAHHAPDPAAVQPAVHGDEHGFADAGALAATMRQELGPAYEVQERVPFVIAGKSGDPYAEAIADSLPSALASFRSQFIDTPPSRTLRVYLFPDHESYADFCRRRRGEEPPSRFGFFVPGTRQLILDASTGGGTLIHELVHALMLDDFPTSPKWFDEGFASLFEQSAFRDEGIVGMVNWRLPELQTALAEGKTIPLHEVFSATYADFDGERRGLLYAEARYLCLYLQERGWLAGYYRKFKAAIGKDPTGVETLQAVTGQRLEDLEAAYFKWAGALRR